MRLCNDEVVNYFVNGGTHGQSHSGNLFIEGEVLYSYGHHFPLMIRMEHWLNGTFLMNADKYSVTTSQHQGLCWRYADIMLSFAMLRAAGMDMKSSRDREALILVDTRKAFEVSTGYFRYQKLTGKILKQARYYFDGEFHDKPRIEETPERQPIRITKRDYEALPDFEQQHCSEIRERRPQLTVFSFNGKHYLSGMDDRSYFISQLPGKPQTVDAAEYALRPAGLDPNAKFRRQGEWFFLEVQGCTQTQLNKAYRALKADYTLPRNLQTCWTCKGQGEVRSYVFESEDDKGPVYVPCGNCRGRGKVPGGNRHTATRGGKYLAAIAEILQLNPDIQPFKLTRNTQIVSGSIKHPEHTRARLSTLATGIKMFAAFKNRALDSWSSGPMGLNID